MNSFRDEYRQAVEELPKFKMDAGQVQNRLHHRRIQKIQRNKMMEKSCVAAALFLICGVSVISMRSKLSIGAEIPESSYAVVSEEEQQYAVAMCNEEKISARAMMVNEEEYQGLEEFLKDAPAASRLPDIALLESEFEDENVMVSDEGMYISVMVAQENKYFKLVQTDYSGTEIQLTGDGYGEAVAEERNYKNSQGQSYKVFDTIEDGQTKVTHAVIFIEGRGLSMEFRGFDMEAIEAVLENLKLTIYIEE